MAIKALINRISPGATENTLEFSVILSGMVNSASPNEVYVTVQADDTSTWQQIKNRVKLATRAVVENELGESIVGGSFLFPEYTRESA